MGILVGTSSWTDPTLTRDATFYPKKTMSAEERLRFYASVFTAVEVDATYYAPPNKETAARWAERTPEGFRMEVKAYSLFTQHPTKPASLWPDLRDELGEEVAAKRNLYLGDLPDDVVDEAWARFGHAIEPLQEAGRLGAVVLQFPPWFTAKRANREYLATLPERLPGTPLAVELRHGSWLAEADRERTLDLLRALRLTYVCVDGPQGFPSSIPPVVEATADLALVRFHGHNAENWAKKGITAAERFRYLYGEDELAGWAPRLRALDDAAEETHALFNNCYSDFGVRNAYQLGRLLDEGLQPDAPAVEAGAASG